MLDSRTNYRVGWRTKRSNILASASATPSVPVATYQVVTVGAATHTIASLGVSASTLVDWGDGNQDTYTGTAQRTHNYAGAGTWTVTIYTPQNVTVFNMTDSKVIINTATLPITNVGTFIVSGTNAATTVNTGDMLLWSPTIWNCHSMVGGTFTINSSHMSSWSPTDFRCFSLPSGTYNFDSSHVSSWSPVSFILASMPSGTYSIDTSHMSSWSPIDFRCFSMPAGTTFSISANGFAGFIRCTTMFFHGNGLSQAQVDTVLWSIYQASVAPRTGLNGTVNVGGTNAAPSGTFQAATICPVTVATPGKEIAHELLNDTCNAFANHWATVTITA